MASSMSMPGTLPKASRRKAKKPKSASPSPARQGQWSGVSGQTAGTSTPMAHAGQKHPRGPSALNTRQMKKPRTTSRGSRT